jgi:hypothetical protein
MFDASLPSQNQKKSRTTEATVKFARLLPFLPSPSSNKVSSRGKLLLNLFNGPRIDLALRLRKRFECLDMPTMGLPDSGLRKEAKYGTDDSLEAEHLRRDE